MPLPFKRNNTAYVSCLVIHDSKQEAQRSTLSKLEGSNYGRIEMGGYEMLIVHV
jgi:hypothetical protein